MSDAAHDGGPIVDPTKGPKADMRQFKTGATRDSEAGKPDHEGFWSPIVIQRYGEYMDKHRKQPNGEVRASDNWQLGMPKHVFMKSLWRHFLDLWLAHRGYASRDGIEDAACAALFNLQGYLRELLEERGYAHK